MVNGLFTSSEEIKLQKEYMAPIARPQKVKRKKFKPLFTSREEIQFQRVYMAGHVEQEKPLSTDLNQIRQENRRISQNIKRLNLSAQRCILSR